MRRLALTMLATLFLSGCAVPNDPAAEPWRNPLLIAGEAVRLQIDYVPGRAPTTLALDALVSAMELVGTSVVVHLAASLDESDGNYSVDEIISLHRQIYAGDSVTWRDPQGRAVLHILYLEGSAAQEETFQSIHGFAFRLTGYPLIAIFPETLPTTSFFKANVAVPGQSRETFERSALLHEYGHMLGLVGCGLPQTQQRMDPDSACHSTNDRSVMFAQIHASTDVAAWVFDDERQPVWRFDAADWADIRAGQAAGT